MTNTIDRQQEMSYTYRVNNLNTNETDDSMMSERQLNKYIDLVVRLSSKGKPVPVDVISKLQDEGIDTAYLMTIGDH